jgi:hypothetical protein
MSALVFTNSAGALSRSNIVDYAILPGAAVLSNNLRDAFTVAPKLKMKSIAREGNNIRLTWVTRGTHSNFVQVTTGTTTGSYTNNFTNITAAAIITVGSGDITTNYLDVGGATNKPSRFYRIRAVP